MKKITLLLGIAFTVALNSLKAQSTTTTTAPMVQQAETSVAAPTGDNSGAVAGDFSRFYIGVRFMPTFTKFNVQTIDAVGGTIEAKTNFTVGYGVGGFLGYNFSNHFALQAEVIYSALSQKYTDVQTQRETKVSLSYLNIPLLLSFNTDVSRPINFNVSVGPQVGINTGSKLDVTNVSADNGVAQGTATGVLAVKVADIGFAYGAGLDFKVAESLTLDLGFRGVYGLVDVSDNSKSKTTNQYYVLDRSHVVTYAGYIGARLNF